MKLRSSGTSSASFAVVRRRVEATNFRGTLASRLSTASNMGKLDCRDDATSMILGNLVLVQCQGIIVGALGSLVGMGLTWAPSLQFHAEEAMLLATSAIVTASLASFILGLVMVAVVLP